MLGKKQKPAEDKEPKSVSLVTNVEPEPTVLWQKRRRIIGGGLGAVVVVFVAVLILRTSALTDQFVPADLGQSTATRTGVATPQANTLAAGGSFIKFPGAESKGKFYITPKTSSVANGANVTVDVRIDPQTAQIGLVENVTVTYDPAKLQYVSADMAGSPFSAELGMATSPAGTIKRSSYLPGDTFTAADSLVMKLTFKALAGTGTTGLSVNGIAYDNTATDTKPTGDNATVTLTGGSGTPTGARCALQLRGLNSTDLADTTANNTLIISLGGQQAYQFGDSPNHMMWRYDTDTNYAAAMTKINNALASKNCGQIVVRGHSNGGAMAAKMYCKGETFGGRLVGTLLDDPVPDHGIDNCASAGKPLQLIFSNEFNAMIGAGNKPCSADWYCQGNFISHANYASQLGVTAQYKNGHGDRTGDETYYGPFTASWWTN